MRHSLLSRRPCRRSALLLVLAGGWFVIDHTAAIITIGLWAGMTLLAIGATQAAAAIAVWRAAKNS